MTKHESFKKRVRARMEKTGERYTAARRAVIEQKGSGWVSTPEHPNESVSKATGRGWDEWTAIIDNWPGSSEGHAAIARFLQDEHGVGAWWAQSVTVGYERIKGLRLPYQQSDGKFATSKSKTVGADGTLLRSMLENDGDRSSLFPGLETELRSGAESKSLRLGMPEGTATIAIDPTGDARIKVTVQHAQLDSPDEVELWRDYWSEWLESLDS